MHDNSIHSPLAPHGYYFHLLDILRGIGFPFMYQKFKAQGRNKYVHVLIIVALVPPMVPALLPLIDVYSIVLSPIDVCIGRNAAFTYFTLVLPFNILFAGFHGIDHHVLEIFKVSIVMLSASCLIFTVFDGNFSLNKYQNQMENQRSGFR